jgi:hypothetical protein
MMINRGDIRTRVNKEGTVIRNETAVMLGVLRVQSHPTKTHIWIHIWFHIKYTPFYQTLLWNYYHSMGAGPHMEIVECSGYSLILAEVYKYHRIPS